MIINWLRGVRLGRRLGIAVTALAVAVVGAVVVPSSPAAATPGSDIIGRYTLDANGWLGDLYIDSIDSNTGRTSGRMFYYARGITEYVSGYWSPSANVLNLERWLPDGEEQSYVLYLGTHVAGHPVFGGYFSQYPQPYWITYGVFANNFVPASNPPSWTPYPGWGSSLSVCWVGCTRPTNPPQGTYAFDGNGWSGLLYLPAGSSTAYMKFDALGYWEPVTMTSGRWPREITLVRHLSYGNVTQTYVLTLGDGPGSTMLGGYFTESDTDNAYAAFALPIS